MEPGATATAACKDSTKDTVHIKAMEHTATADYEEDKIPNSEASIAGHY
jgi:hypothetical protein